MKSLVVVAVLGIGAVALADEFKTKGVGQTIEGMILSEDSDSYTVKTEYGGSMLIMKRDLLWVRKDADAAASFEKLRKLTIEKLNVLSDNAAKANRKAVVKQLAVCVDSVRKWNVDWKVLDKPESDNREKKPEPAKPRITAEPDDQIKRQASKNTFEWSEAETKRWRTPTAAEYGKHYAAEIERLMQEAEPPTEKPAVPAIPASEDESMQWRAKSWTAEWLEGMLRSSSRMPTEAEIQQNYAGNIARLRTHWLKERKIHSDVDGAMRKLKPVPVPSTQNP